MLSVRSYELDEIGHGKNFMGILLTGTAFCLMKISYTERI